MNPNIVVTGCHRPDTRTLHQPSAAGVLTGRLGDGFVVFRDPHIELIRVGEQIADTAIGIARQVVEMCSDLAAQTADFLGQDNTEFGHQAAHPVVGSGALFDKPLSRAMQTQNDLLVFFLDRDKAHVRPGNRFANRSSIGRVVLAPLAAQPVGTDELRRHQFDGVAISAKQPRPVVGARAGFHANPARRQLDDQRQQLLTRHVGFDQRRLAVLIHPMYRKDVLGEINSNGDNAHGLPLSWFQMDDFDIILLALRCRADLPPLPRDGDVPFIRWAHARLH